MSQPSPSARRLLLILVGALILSLAGLAFNKWRFDRGSRDTAVAINLSILASGDAQSLIDQAHPQLLAQMNASSIQNYIAAVTEILGPLQSIAAISGATELDPMALIRGNPVASYTLDLVFEAEATQAVVELQRSDSEWLVSSYEIESALLYN